MEDTSSASSDSDNMLLAPKSDSQNDCNAATQTPEMPRHAPVELSNQVQPEDNPSTITVYKLNTQKPLNELEQDAKTLAIPDVVVEYIKDSYHRQDVEGEKGVTNPAFESQELIVVRTPSSISLREDATPDNGMTLTTLSSKGNVLYHSMPRNLKSTTDEQPTLLSVADPSLSVSSSSLGYPRSVPPSPNFGYRPLESETSAVYTIIAPVKYVGNGNDKEMEMRLMAQLQEQLEKEKATARKFEFSSSTPVEVEQKRRRLQWVTDIFSILFLVPGILIAIVTPITIIPMFIMPLKYMIPLIAIFVASGIVAVLSLAMSGFIGNIVWYYNEEKKKLRPRLHCGSGPIMHFWGNAFYPPLDDKAPLKKNENIV